LGLFASACAADASAAFVADESQALTGNGESRRPVLMVAGMLQNEETVAPLTDALHAKGFDVTIFVPPDYGLEDIRGYAKQLGEVVEAVRRKTNAAQVDLIGHSEGGVTARRYVKDQIKGAPVHTLISLGSPQQGTDIGSLSTLLRAAGIETWAPALEQLIAGSELLAELNAGDATPGNTRYVTIGTKEDIVTQPVAHAGIPGAENLVVHEVCPERTVGHFGLFEDAWVLQVITSVLTGGPASGNCSALPIGSPI
jgi:triacylglycerol esterase/lipase EstA (alpha/beta hydrolase family)